MFVSHGLECHRICHSAFGIESQLIDCLCTTQQEAETRMFLHVNHISDNGFSKLIVESADTDVEMLAIYFQNFIAAHYYILRGTKNKTRFIDIKEISGSLGPERCKALPGLHALMGCESKSAFVGKGKQAAFKIMHRSEENQSALQHLGESFEMAKEVYMKLERFVCQLYGKTSRDVNDLCYKLFCIKGLQSQQLRRANYQTAIWKRSLESHPEIPSSAENGWNIVNELNS